MADLLKLAAGSLGSGLTWASAGFTAADFNSLTSGSSVVATTALQNGSPLDLQIDVSFVFTVGGTTTALSLLHCYLLPLNQDGSTYGEGLSTGANSGVLPAIGYHVGQVAPKVGVTSTNTITGMFREITLPPGDFRLAIGSGLIIALHSAAAAAVQMRAYVRNLNG